MTPISAWLKMSSAGRYLAAEPSFQRVIATLRSKHRSPGHSLDTNTCEAISALRSAGALRSVPSSPRTRTPPSTAPSNTSRPGCIPARFSLSIRDISLWSCSVIRVTVARTEPSASRIKSAIVSSAAAGLGAAERRAEPPLHALGDDVLPAARLDVHLFPGHLDHRDKQALGKPVLAHHPHRQRPARVGERQLPVARDVQQGVPLHPGHGL